MISTFLSVRTMGCFLGLILTAYGGFEIWLNTTKNHELKSKMCAAWLCPPEFSTERVYDLQRDSPAELPNTTIAEFKQALILDPASPYRWADLGEVLFHAHQLEEARSCFEQAIVRGPNSPSIRIRAANFYLNTGNSQQALKDLATVLANPQLPEFQTPVFLTYTRLGIPIRDVLALGVPPKTFAAQAFLRFLIEGNQLSDAEATWQWIAGRALGDDKLTADYLSFLLRNKKDAAASDTWKQLTRSNMPIYGEDNWIYNGSFNQTPGPAPFDWQIASTDDVQAKRVQGPAQDGGWSLEFDFDGKANVDYHQVFEESVLRPGAWQLRAFVKTDGVTTDQGVSIRIYDVRAPQKLDIRTDSITGNTNWMRVERNFHISEDTSLVRVEVIRQASTKFDNKVAGRAWVDGIELVRVNK